MENEILFHEDRFDKIIILALELSRGADITRPYPSNADVYNTSSGQKRILRMQDLLKGSMHFFNKNNLCDEDRLKIGNSVSKKVFSDYFEQRSIRQFNECLDILNKYDFTKYDDVLIYSYWFFSICRTGVYIKNYLKSKNINVRLISRAHRYDLYEYINKLDFLPYRNTMAKECEAVYTCSENGRDYLKNTIPKYKNRFFCSYLGTTDYGTGTYSCDDFHIVTCSRTTQVKRIDRFIKALSAAESLNMNIRWTHIGDGALQQEVIKLAKDKLKNIKFEFSGNLDNLAVIDFYKKNPVSVFVNVSLNEGLPVSIMEAASFGIPVIATDVGGTSEIIKDGYNGYLIDKDFSDSEFTDTLAHIYNMPEFEYKIIRKNARDFWQKHFNAENNYPAFIDSIIKQEIKVTE